MNQVTLSDLISSGGKLNEAQVGSLYSLVASGCRQKNRQRLDHKLDVPLSCWENFGIYRRVIIHDDGVSYCAGQSYPDEIRTVRQCMLGQA